jgi:hypothetical protein
VDNKCAWHEVKAETSWKGKKNAETGRKKNQQGKGIKETKCLEEA